MFTVVVNEIQTRVTDRVGRSAIIRVVIEFVILFDLFCRKKMKEHFVLL